VERGIDDAPLVGDLYALGTDGGDRQSGEKDSVVESHVEYLGAAQGLSFNYNWD
jgi:hypothetical protein